MHWQLKQKEVIRLVLVKIFSYIIKEWPLKQLQMEDFAIKYLEI